MDGEFERIDINQCDISEGNERPNMFAGTHRCRPTTMVCILIHTDYVFVWVLPFQDDIAFKATVLFLKKKKTKNE